MASQFGAHLSHGAAIRPSIFEVLAQENLAIGLRTAVRYVTHFSAQTWPERWGFLYSHADEIILAMDILMQYHHLRVYNASFAEHFYGLAREGKIKMIRFVVRAKMKDLYLNIIIFFFFNEKIMKKT